MAARSYSSHVFIPDPATIIECGVLWYTALDDGLCSWLHPLSVIIIIIIKIVHEVQKDRIRQKKGQNNQHVHK